MRYDAVVGASTHPLLEHPGWLPAVLMDYVWVVALYGTSAIAMAVLIDGHLLARFDEQATRSASSALLLAEVLVQVAAQGFVVMVATAALATLPSPADGLLGYDHRSPVGQLVRNPAIMTVILFSLSKSLQGRLRVLFSRFDQNAALEKFAATGRLPVNPDQLSVRT